MALSSYIETLHKLNNTKGTKVSIYIPTHPRSAGGNLKADQTRLKNAIQELKHDLPKHESALHKIVEKLQSLLNDGEFWMHQTPGLAIFVTEESLETIKLNLEVTPQVHKGSKFFLSPLIIANDLQFSALVLDVNLSNPRMFIADMKWICEVESFDIKSMKQLMEEDHEQHQQFYSPVGDKGTPMYHGHGGSNEQTSEEIEIYMRYIVNEASELIKQYNLPILLCGDQHRLSHISKLLGDFNVLERELHGNKQHMNESELHEEIKPLLEDMFSSETQKELKALQESKLKTSGITKVLKEVQKNAVAKLFVPILRKTSDGVKSGYSDTYLLESNTSNQFEALISQTIEHGGEVHAVTKDQLKSSKPTALLRF